MDEITEMVHESFKTLYLSKKYSLTELAQKLGIARTSVYNLKRLYFPNDENNKWRRRMFAKLHEAGTFDIEEMAGLLRTTRTTVLRFKREYEKFSKLRNSCKRVINQRSIVSVN